MFAKTQPSSAGILPAFRSAGILPAIIQGGQTPAFRRKQGWTVAMACGLCLALGAVWAPAQQAPAPQQPARKAKKVWSNEDIERKPAEKPADASLQAYKPSPELLQKLQEIEDAARRTLEELEPRRDAILAEVEELHRQRDAATSPEAQAPIVRKIEGKMKELEEVSRQISPAQWRIKEVQAKREALAPPPEPTLKDIGIPVGGESSPKKEKKEEPKPAPPK